MDRLDALKARLKKLPVEDPDFKEPISGEISPSTRRSKATSPHSGIAGWR